MQIEDNRIYFENFLDTNASHLLDSITILGELTSLILRHQHSVYFPRRPSDDSQLDDDSGATDLVWDIDRSIEGGLKSGPAEPMPEDAKGQAVSALRRIGLVLRLAFYAGLGVCVTGTIGFVGLHLWIEYLELSPPQTTTRNDQSIIKYSWEDEIKRCH
ncbi:hypothetical protein Pst134EA_032080 [Puccinia striiformis f. sp. tritici]|uniref:uncharacterized protein n=1 Tax=Puccinia striiformis f. sp. tritici TaxID=168172 RepID=UPI0020076CC2|nr:uncharacterized protein Pst134EA_032080 [Puccinia striiformis f. sp. tritici]KAH9441921.1 hypothetical protein Pst134EA_032080 [Puccinia striiformis f. sp. tritici]